MKTLVLLHGWGATGKVWGRQAAALGKLLPVLTPTLPVWEAGWLAGYLGQVPLEECLVVGWSLGGMLLLEALPELKTSPGGLVLVGVAASFCRRPDHPWGQTTGAVRAMRRALKENPQKVLQDFALRCLGRGEEAFQEEVAAQFATPPHPENLAPGLDYLLNQDLRGRLSRIPAGATIIQGEEDAIVPQGQAHFLHAQLTGSRLHLLPDTGHLSFLTQAAAVNGILEGILRGGPGEFFVSAPPPSPQTPLPTPCEGAGEGEACDSDFPGPHNS